MWVEQSIVRSKTTKSRRREQSMKMMKHNRSHLSRISNSNHSSWGTRFKPVPSLVEPCLQQLLLEAISWQLSFFWTKESDGASGIVFVFRARAESEHAGFIGKPAYSCDLISGRWLGGIYWGTRLIYLDFSNLAWNKSR